MIQSQEEALRLAINAGVEEGKREDAIHYLRDHASPEAAEQLVKLLEDDAAGVRWAAAMALARYGSLGLRPLLHALIQPNINTYLREGAHRVLSHTTAPQSLNHLPELLSALQGLGANVATMDIAGKILRELA